MQDLQLSLFVPSMPLHLVPSLLLTHHPSAPLSTPMPHSAVLTPVAGGSRGGLPTSIIQNHLGSVGDSIVLLLQSSSTSAKLKIPPGNRRLRFCTPTMKLCCAVSQTPPELEVRVRDVSNSAEIGGEVDEALVVSFGRC